MLWKLADLARPGPATPPVPGPVQGDPGSAKRGLQGDPPAVDTGPCTQLGISKQSPNEQPGPRGHPGPGPPARPPSPLPSSLGPSWDLTGPQRERGQRRRLRAAGCGLVGTKAPHIPCSTCRHGSNSTTTPKARCQEHPSSSCKHQTCADTAEGPREAVTAPADPEEHSPEDRPEDCVEALPEPCLSAQRWRPGRAPPGRPVAAAQPPASLTASSSTPTQGTSHEPLEGWERLCQRLCGVVAALLEPADPKPGPGLQPALPSGPRDQGATGAERGWRPSSLPTDPGSPAPRLPGPQGPYPGAAGGSYGPPCHQGSSQRCGAPTCPHAGGDRRLGNREAHDSLHSVPKRQVSPGAPLPRSRPDPRAQLYLGFQVRPSMPSDSSEAGRAQAASQLHECETC
ncbi:collagen alpha-1(I) chain-like [Canis lupus dingo]|uniref:collagen alpha-1(I) chain-like n=1 Tax=Canis lupus dingo TaxID=286419 RepID=UPI000DC68282|nr:collagen alpha-1(I) chain-like [Canis lupus dingo]